MNGLRLIVVGAGIIGSSIAREAARRGASVQVIEADEPGSGASGAAVGACQPLTGMRLSYRQEHLEGFELMKRWLRDADPRIHTKPGILRLVRKRKQAELWRERAMSYPSGLARWIDADVLYQREPGLAPGILGGVLVVDGMFIDVPRWIRANLKVDGVSLMLGTRACAIDESATGVRLTLEDRTVVQGDLLVVAAGVATRAPLVNTALEWTSYKGEIGVFEGITAPSHHLSHRGYLIPWGRERVLVGVVDSRPPFEDGVSPSLESQLLGRARQVWARVSPRARMVAAWAGVRPALGGNEPKIGVPAGYRRVAICVGHGGKGLLLGPLSAVATCDVLEGREPNVPKAWLLDPQEP